MDQLEKRVRPKFSDEEWNAAMADSAERVRRWRKRYHLAIHPEKMKEHLRRLAITELTKNGAYIINTKMRIPRGVQCEITYLHFMECDLKVNTDDPILLITGDWR
jgi:hypothetical protein